MGSIEGRLRSIKIRDGVRRGCGVWIVFVRKRSDLEVLVGDSIRIIFLGEVIVR